MFCVFILRNELPRSHFNVITTMVWDTPSRPKIDPLHFFIFFFFFFSFVVLYYIQIHEISCNFPKCLKQINQSFPRRFKKSTRREIFITQTIVSSYCDNVYTGTYKNLQWHITDAYKIAHYDMCISMMNEIRNEETFLYIVFSIIESTFHITDRVNI